MQEESESTTARPVETTTLSVPASARYARVVRMTAANLASIADFGVDDVEDIRMAAEEAFVYACATGVSGEMAISFDLAQDCVTMRFELGDATPDDEETQTSMQYATLLLDALCDSREQTADPSTLVLVKRLGHADAL